MDAVSFWERANSLIKSGKTTQRALSKECGFTERRIETLVSTGRLPDAIEAYRIAQALGVTVEYLVSGEHPDSNPSYLDALKSIRDIANKALP